MPNTNEGANIVCPYYITHTKLSLTCEGVIEGTTMVSKFHNAELRDQHIKQYCECFGYPQCPEAKMIELKYQTRNP